MNWDMIAALCSIATLAVVGLVFVMRLEGKARVHDEKFNTVSAQFAAVDHRFLAMESSLARIEAKLDRVIERGKP